MKESAGSGIGHPKFVSFLVLDVLCCYLARDSESFRS